MPHLTTNGGVLIGRASPKSTSFTPCATRNTFDGFSQWIRKVAANHLDRNRAVEAVVIRPIHDAHAALAEFAGDAIASDALWHRMFDYSRAGRGLRQAATPHASCMLQTGAATIWCTFVSPINRQVVTWTPETLPPNWAEFGRDRWHFFHAVRCVLFLIGFACVTLSVIADKRPAAARHPGAEDGEDMDARSYGEATMDRRQRLTDRRRGAA